MAHVQLGIELFDRLIGPITSASPEGVAPFPRLPAVDEMGETTGELAAPTRPSIIMPAGARVVERRQVRRTRFGQRARTCLEPELSIGIWDTVMLQDISVAGLSFLAEGWFDVGSVVHVTVEDRTGVPIRLRCMVRRCERGGIGGVWFTIGVTFDALLTDIPGGVADDAAETPAAPGPKISQAFAGQSGGLLSRFKPSRWFAGLTRNYDDYSTVSLGRSGEIGRR